MEVASCNCCMQLKELPTLDEVSQFCSRLQTLKPAPVRERDQRAFHVPMKATYREIK